MKILITGGAGFIGKWLVKKLSSNHKIIIIDSLDGQVHKVTQDFSPDLKARAICIKADVQSIETYKAVLEGIDVVIHLAAQTGTGQSMYEISKYIQHNVNGTAKLLECVSKLKHKPRRIILFSSRAVYGDGAYTDGNEIHYPERRSIENLQKEMWEFVGCKGEKLKSLPMREEHLTKPMSVYAWTKLWQEQLLQNYCGNHGIDLVALRFQNVYGPKQELGNPYTGIIGIFTNAISQGNSLELFEDGLVTRDFVFVGDVAEAVVQCVLYEVPINSIINVGTSQAVTLIDVVETIAKLVNKPANYSISGRFRVGDVRHAVADMNYYQDIFGQWSPTSLKDGLPQYLEWYLVQDPLSHSVLQESFQEMERTGLLLSKQS